MVNFRFSLQECSLTQTYQHIPQIYCTNTVMQDMQKKHADYVIIY